VKDPAAPSFDLRLRADRATVLDNEQGRVLADAQISMFGPFAGVTVTGGARVREGVIYIPASNKQEVINADDPSVFAVIDTTRLTEDDIIPTESPLVRNLRMDLALAVDRDTWVRNKEANVEIYSDGDLRIRMDRAKETIYLDGVVNTDRGQYEFLSKRFQVRSGSVQFTNTAEIDPNLQITAEIDAGQTQSGPLVIRLLIGGTLQAPRLTLESDAQPPIPQTDLLSYLAFGSPSGEIPILGGGGQSSLVGGSAAGGLVGPARAYATQQLTGVVLGVMVDQLEARTARSLGADVVNITPASGVPAELASLRTGGLEQLAQTTQVEIGKYYGPNTFIALQSTPTFYKDDPPIPGFRAEHRFGPQAGFTLQATWQPRYFLPVPTLGTSTIDQRNTFGFFLARRGLL
jgi:autotransporter translocation and assembly factor TamB